MFALGLVVVMSLRCIESEQPTERITGNGGVSQSQCP
jgi:hypothetical protein